MDVRRSDCVGAYSTCPSGKIAADKYRTNTASISCVYACVASCYVNVNACCKLCKYADVYCVHNRCSLKVEFRYEMGAHCCRYLYFQLKLQFRPPGVSCWHEDHVLFNTRVTVNFQMWMTLKLLGHIQISQGFDTIVDKILNEVKTEKKRMWANAQHDGRPAEHRWRPLFNASKFGWRRLLDAMQ